MSTDRTPSPPPQEIPLDQRISFRLQRIGTLLTTQAVTLLKRAGGLTLNQWRLLSFLSERDGGSLHELVQFAHIDKATMSRAAAELLKKQLITSAPSRNDRRTATLSLTETGRETVTLVAPIMIARQAELLDALSATERKALFRTLDKLETAIAKSELGSP